MALYLRIVVDFPIVDSLTWHTPPVGGRNAQLNGLSRATVMARCGYGSG